MRFLYSFPCEIAAKVQDRLKTIWTDPHALIAALYKVSIFSIIIGVILFYLAEQIDNSQLHALRLISITDRLSAKNDVINLIGGLVPPLELAQPDILRQAYRYYLEMQGVDFPSQEEWDKELAKIGTLEDYRNVIDLDKVDVIHAQALQNWKHSSDIKKLQNWLFLAATMIQIFNAILAFRLAKITTASKNTNK